MFMFKAKEIIKEINKFSPEILLSCKNSINKSILDLDFQRLDKVSFEKCPDISIDIAVMEKTSKGIVIPLDVDGAILVVGKLYGRPQIKI